MSGDLSLMCLFYIYTVSDFDFGAQCIHDPCRVALTLGIELVSRLGVRNRGEKI